MTTIPKIKTNDSINFPNEAKYRIEHGTGALYPTATEP